MTGLVMPLANTYGSERAIHVTPDNPVSFSRGGVSKARSAAEIDKKDGTTLERLTRFVSKLESGIRNASTDASLNEYFNLSKTPKIVKSILSGEYFTIKANVIKQHYNKDADHRITPQDWINISEALHDPLVISRYSKVNNLGKRYYPENTYRVWVETVINGHYAMVGVEVKSPQKNITVNSVSTAYGDHKVAIDEKDVVYSRNNGEGIRTLLSGPNAQLYSGFPQSSANSIPNIGGEVKGNLQLSRPIERRKDLIALHNLSAEKLKGADELGGFTMPRISYHINEGEAEGFLAARRLMAEIATRMEMEIAHELGKVAPDTRAVKWLNERDRGHGVLVLKAEPHGDKGHVSLYVLDSSRTP